MQTATATRASIYDELGVRPIINARGHNTLLGGSTPSERVRAAMRAAEDAYVDMQELLERSGAMIADLLGCEAAYVTPGAAAALALGTAACITGPDVERMARLPDTSGLKNTVLIQRGHRYHYERVVTIVGARLVEVGTGSRAELEAALGPQVASVLVPAHLDGAPGTLRLPELLDIAHAHGVPVLVDAASRVFPIDLFTSYTRMGVDLVAFGGKYFGGLNASGILCGRKALIDAAVPQGFIGYETVAYGKSFGRPLKLDRQTIVGVVVALREWLSMDHDQRLRSFEQRLAAIAAELDGLLGVATSIEHGDGSMPRVLKIGIDPRRAARDVEAVVASLRSGTPSIVVGADATSIWINPTTLKPEEDQVVAGRLRELVR